MRQPGPPTRKKEYPLPITHPPCPKRDSHVQAHEGHFGVAVYPETPMILTDSSPKYHWVCLACGVGWWQGSW